MNFVKWYVHQPITLVFV